MHYHYPLTRYRPGLEIPPVLAGALATYKEALARGLADEHKGAGSASRGVSSGPSGPSGGWEWSKLHAIFGGIFDHQTWGFLTSQNGNLSSKTFDLTI